MSSDYTQTDSPSIFYLDYGGHTLVYDFQSDINEVCTSTPSVSNGGHRYEVRSVRPAYIEGYRVAFSAVSREGPRLGLLNLVPRLEPQPYILDGAASPVQSAMKEAEELEQRLASVNPTGRVYGVLYELPEEARAAVLEMVGREGSFNQFATLPCKVIQDTPSSPEGKTSVTDGTALVCAALDMDLLVSRFLVPEALRLAWQPMPPIVEFAEAKAKDPRVCGSGRWPYMHWCNCITSNRLAPEPEYLKCFREMLQSSCLADALPAGIKSIDELLCLYYALGPQDYTSAGEGVVEADSAIRTRNVAANPAEARTYYLAYGSNLSWEQVCLRIGPPYERRPVKLHGYELVANKVPYSAQYSSFGYYNVEPCEVRRDKEAAAAAAEQREVQETENGTSERPKRTSTTMPPYVCGAAYEISQAQLHMMDTYEGGYHRELLPCEDISEKPEERLEGLACWTYIAEETAEDLLPSKEYLHRVLEGADILPAEYIEGIRTTPTNPLRSPRQDRRLRKEL